MISCPVNCGKTGGCPHCMPPAGFESGWFDAGGNFFPADNPGLTHSVGDDCPGGDVEGGDSSPRGGSRRFYDILHELAALHAKKQKDYGTEADPFANVRGSEEWGVEPWVGALIRATDKLKRLQKFARHGELANEAVEDSFRDLAVYAIIGLVLYEETQEVSNDTETEQR